MIAVLSCVLLLLQSKNGVYGLTAWAAPATVSDNLTTDLLSGYNKDVIPVLDPLQPIHVYPVISLYQIISLDGKTQILTFSGAIGMGWVDVHMGWNPSNYGGITLTTLPLESVWKPDIGIQNSVDGALFDLSEDSKNRVQVIGPSYLVMWQSQRVYTVSCPLDMTYFPFDTQTCTIRLVTMSLPASHLEMRILSSNISLDYYQKSTEWEILETSTSTSQLKFLEVLQFTGLELNSVFTAELKLKRRSGYYVVHLILPCVFISILTSITFYIPSEAGEKISFSVTLLLAFTVYQLIIAESLPKSSETTPLLSIYLTILIAMSASSVFLAMVVLNVHHHDPGKPVPRWAQVIMFQCLATLVFKRQAVKELGLDINNAKVVPSVREDDKPEARFTGNSKTDMAEPDRPTGQKSLSELNLIKQREGRVTTSKSNVRSIAADLDTTTSSLRGDAQPPDFGRCWVLSADILNTFFLWIYLLILAMTSLILLIILPSIYA